MIANFLPSKIACPYCFVDGLSNQMTAQDNQPNGAPIDAMQDLGSCTEWFDGHLQPYTCDENQFHTAYLPFMKPANV